MNNPRLDAITGALGLMCSLTYVYLCRQIEDSLLSDGVGASGVPMGVGIFLMAISTVLLARSTWHLLRQKTSIEVTAGDAEEGWSPHLKAAGLLCILVVYVVALPILGYVISVGLLVGAISLFAGAALNRTTLACAVLSGPLLWLMFDWALEIRMPKTPSFPLLGI